MSKDFMTASDIKALLGTGGDKDDPTWSLLAAAVCAYIRRECGKDFVKDTRTECLDGTGKEIIFPAHTPISAITSLVDTEYNIIYSSSDYVIYPNMIRLRKGRQFITGLQNIQLVYTAGETPDDIKRAAELIAVHWFRRRHTVGKTSDGGTQGTQVSVDKADIPPEALLLLTKCKSTNYFDLTPYNGG